MLKTVKDPLGVRRGSGRRLPPVVQAGWFVISAVAAAYLWAVVFGDGIAGLAGSYTLDHRNYSDLPNANYVFLAAVAAYLASPFLAAWWGSATGSLNIPRWFLLTGALGFGAFAASRLFV
jgi:hypothetical protein